MLLYFKVYQVYSIYTKYEYTLFFFLFFVGMVDFLGDRAERFGISGGLSANVVYGADQVRRFGSLNPVSCLDNYEHRVRHVLVVHH